MNDNDFIPFPKMARLSREIIVTEKLDGTNAQICIGEDGTIRAGSRSRWITPQDDNYGFARWVEAHADELRELEPRPPLRRVVGSRHPAQLQPDRKAVLAVQCLALGR